MRKIGEKLREKWYYKIKERKCLKKGVMIFVLCWKSKCDKFENVLLDLVIEMVGMEDDGFWIEWKMRKW